MKHTSIIGVYEDEDVLLKAMDELQGNGVEIADVFSPIQKTLSSYTAYPAGLPASIAIGVIKPSSIDIFFKGLLVPSLQNTNGYWNPNVER